ncbi:unnamed protein product, partial [Allacma fusca]
MFTELFPPKFCLSKYIMPSAPDLLLDQYENVSLHTQKGIDFLERYGSFLRDRASIEVDYATKL